MRILSLAAALAFALAAPAAAQTTPPPVERPGPQFFFECTGPTKLQNNERNKKWSLVPPAISYTAGGGCGYLDPGPIIGTRSNTPYDASFGGTYGGQIEDMTVELHNLVLGQARLSQDTPLKVRLLVDGDELLDQTTPPQINVAPEMSSSGLSEKLVFSITNIKLPALQPGDERTIVLDVGSPYLDAHNAFVWGATEIPANVAINPVKLLGPKIKK